MDGRRGTEPAVAWAHDGGGGVVIDQGPAGYAMRRDAGRLDAGSSKSVDRWTLADREKAAIALGKPAMPMFMTPNMAAGLWTTGGDYARFLAFARRYPALSTPTTRVIAASFLSAETFRASSRIRVKNENLGVLVV